MKGLTELIKESLKESMVMEALSPKAKKYLRSADEVITDDGDGWVIGKSFDFYDDDDADVFAENLKLCLDLFGVVFIGGDDVTKPIDMDEALEMIERNGEDPEGTMYFVYNEGDRGPAVWSDFLINWK